MKNLILPNSPALHDAKAKQSEDSFELESSETNSDTSTTQDSLESLSNFKKTQNFFKKINPITNLCKQTEDQYSRANYSWKIFIVVVGLSFMFTARFGVPANDVKNVQDNVLDYFMPVNNWIHNKAHTFAPKIMLFACATNMDLIFFITIFHWFKYGKTGRLPVALSAFYLIRTFVQQMSFQPYPSGYYWDSPGFPSFVAPYGRSTDFFFSGHSGFLVLMANEWGKLGYKWIKRYIQIVLIYTIFVLLACQAHYSIDIFTGVFFADYVFGKVDKHKDTIDAFFINIAKVLEGLLGKIVGKKNEKVEKKEE